MGRRNEHSRQQIKERAIRAGREIIESKGFSGLSARKVAGKIGYTVGTLYNVFDNFTDLICHINSETLDDLGNYLEASLKPGLAGTDALIQLGNSYVPGCTARATAGDGVSIRGRRRRTVRRVCALSTYQ